MLDGIRDNENLMYRMSSRISSITSYEFNGPAVSSYLKQFFARYPNACVNISFYCDMQEYSKEGAV